MKATSRPDTAVPPVAVQLTPIVPIRVFDTHGEYFDTEVDFDAPLRSLQLAIEDYFKIKPEVQLLLHNRQQIHADKSLRDNGCLMLKGDPYVKIVCAIKRGPILNLQCEVGSTTYVVACSEMATVWEVKRLLCGEMECQQRRASSAAATTASTSGTPPRHLLTCGPERLRLLWRYMELNDRATLHYYRVPTNAMLHVMHRKRAVAPPPGWQQKATPSAAPSPSPSSARETAPNRAPPEPTVWWQRPPPFSPSQQPPPPPRAARSPEEYNEAFNAVSRPVPPYTAPAPAVPPYIAAGYAGPSPAMPSVAPPPQHYDPLTSAETVQLALRLHALEDQLRALWQALQEQRQLGDYQRGSLSDTHQRIIELQEQMERVLWLQEQTARFIPT